MIQFCPTIVMVSMIRDGVEGRNISAFVLAGEVSQFPSYPSE